MPDRLMGMQVFVQVARQGSFAAAARALGLSQTMISKHVAALEQQLGVALLHRSTRRLSLTDPGKRFLERCQSILADIEQLDAEFMAQRHAPSGNLRFNAPVSFATRYLAPLLPAFHDQYPDVTVELGLDDRRVNLIEEGWDLALRIRRLEPNSLRVRKLAMIRFVVCAAPSYLERFGTPKTVSDLERHQCLGYTLGDWQSAWRWRFGHEGEATVSVRGALSANSGDALREAALRGMGIIYQPVFIIADDLASGRLIELPLDLPLVNGPELHAIYPAGREASPKVRAMIDFLVQAYGNPPPWERAVSGSPV